MSITNILLAIIIIILLLNYLVKRKNNKILSAYFEKITNQLDKVNQDILSKIEKENTALMESLKNLIEKFSDVMDKIENKNEVIIESLKTSIGKLSEQIQENNKSIVEEIEKENLKLIKTLNEVTKLD